MTSEEPPTHTISADALRGPAELPGHAPQPGEKPPWWSTSKKSAPPPPPSIPPAVPDPVQRDWLDDILDGNAQDTDARLDSTDGPDISSDTPKDSATGPDTPKDTPDTEDVAPEKHDDIDEEPAPERPPRRRAPDWSPPPAPQVRQSAAEWWRGFSVAHNFLLLNSSAVAAGTWSAGLFTGDWSTGIPQLTLAAMHDSAAESTSSSTPLLLGGLIVLGSAIAGAAAAGLILRVVGTVPTLARFVHWALVRVPVTSTLTGLCLYTTT